MSKKLLSTPLEKSHPEAAAAVPKRQGGFLTGSTKPKLIVIVGPTASGKSALAIKVAKKFGGEIISADSRQIYKEMNIGTAKPTKKEMDEIKHHLIDIKNPNEEYTVADYKKDAVKAIGKIIKKSKLPVLAGGTGLYVKAVVDNLEIPEVRPNPALRKKLERRIGKKELGFNGKNSGKKLKPALMK